MQPGDKELRPTLEIEQSWVLPWYIFSKSSTPMPRKFQYLSEQISVDLSFSLSHYQFFYKNHGGGGAGGAGGLGPTEADKYT